MPGHQLARVTRKQSTAPMRSRTELPLPRTTKQGVVTIPQRPEENRAGTKASWKLASLAPSKFWLVSNRYGTKGRFPMIRSSAVCALTFAALIVTAASATAQTRVQAGILQCRGAPTGSFIVGSVHELGCVFQSDRGPRYRYYGVVRRVGLDIGFTEQ